ncbi:MAG: SAM-dependent methyltransferase [Betaproteobacteria bacterium]|nr:SAM-dependent methyltransferase [Betaproteobacteria bacterium]
MAGILYAIPTPLGASPEESLPASALLTVRSLRDFAVENAKSARAFLSAAGCDPKLASIHQIGEEIAPLLQPLREGRPLGLLSEAGCPAIADPGAKLVEAAHREGFRVAPLVGPSSIVLALMASGLEGQRFAFCGYLPREKAEREKRIRQLEQRSRREHETQIFIEAPYRNDVLMAALLETCAAETRVCVAIDLTRVEESVSTKRVSAWRRSRPAIGKRPAVFLLQS